MLNIVIIKKYVPKNHKFTCFLSRRWVSEIEDNFLYRPTFYPYKETTRGTSSDEVGHGTISRCRIYVSWQLFLD